MLLRPTGRCFDDALDFLQEVASGHENAEAAQRALDTLTVVHGICLQPIGEPYAHAWVEERQDLVWQGGIVDDRKVFFAVSRNEFYEAREVTESTRYLWRDALRENWRANHYGPWVQKYADLCRPKQVPMRTVAAFKQTVLIMFPARLREFT